MLHWLNSNLDLGVRRRIFGAEAIPALRKVPIPKSRAVSEFILAAKSENNVLGNPAKAYLKDEVLSSFIENNEAGLADMKSNNTAM